VFLSLQIEYTAATNISSLWVCWASLRAGLVVPVFLVVLGFHGFFSCFLCPFCILPVCLGAPTLFIKLLCLPIKKRKEKRSPLLCPASVPEHDEQHSTN
jgi:hypothetical protein